jgi:hypothetical protein
LSPVKNGFNQDQPNLSKMPNYKNGKVYAIRSYQTEEIYIGSTTQKLSDRMYGHRGNFKSKGTCNSKLILQYEDAYIELIEEYSCDNKEQLLRKEGEHIRATNCVNKLIAGRTQKEYREENAEQLRKRSKKNYEKMTQEKRDEKNRKRQERRKITPDNITQEQRDEKNRRKRELRALKKISSS